MIEINNLWKIYNKRTLERTNALSSVSFKIKKEEIISIVGKTGSGKTTLANILLGITKPTDGKVILNNEIIINKKSKKRNLRKITNFLLLSFQYPEHQLFRITVREEILFNSNDEKYMNELIKNFNLQKNLLDKSPFVLSSGQKRKVILISLLIQKPKIIIFDEATSFLDPKSRREFISLLKKVNKKMKTTIIFISHNIQDVINISDRVVLLEEGFLTKIGNPKEVVDFYLKGGTHGKK